MKLLNNFVVYPQQILSNIREFKKHCSAKICAIVKADAYGHGVEAVASCIRQEVDFFGVADECEALKVRNVTSKPILILDMARSANLATLICHNISLSVSNIVYLKQIEKTAKALKIKAKVHLKINSGMNRLGFCNKQIFQKVLDFIYNSEWLVFEGIYTHFCNTDSKECTENQYKIFCEYISLIRKTSMPIVHASASNGVLVDTKYQFDMVRLGIAMYGYCEKISGISPALRITSTIVNIVSVKKGQTVGYGNTFKAPKKMRVACVSLGYADGFLRANSNNAHVIVNDCLVSVVGNVCMDLFMIDVSHIKCKVGDKVVILGKSAHHKIDAEDIARRTHTIPYEVLTNFKRDRMDYIVCPK